MTERIDLRADLHGHAIEYASDVDRRWFAEHPGRDRYIRPPFDHELCHPGHAAEGRCVAMYEAPDGWHHIIEVRQVVPGVRVRAAWRVRDDDGQAA